ncbi:uncharacterized protein LOC132720986 [Ruditapes philippinarum]|uniref:uncharacterized protein LOC132720986 n=1 Tax=Ruditapes philippinarum TaxID=129788 RepID=UPI00295AEA07|nr:uncharacterized protein LOC132720986 [Ruditapes philippinarum]
MYLSNGERSGFMFNIGDSQTNDGNKGDYRTQSYDAEVQGTSRDLAVYGNDHCPNAQDMHYNALEYPVSLANFWIRNKYLKISNDYGFLLSNCSEYLFGLNGQYVAQGQENEDIYIGANRVIFTGFNYRTGVGLCSMKLRWVSGPFQ